MGRQPDDLTPYRSNRHFHGSELRRHRMAAGLSLDGLAGQIPYSKSQLHRVEKAEIMPPPGLSATLDELFGTGEHFQRLYELVRQSPEIHPEQYRRRMAMEARAVRMSVHSGEVVPGLLQTREYARALTDAALPETVEDKISELVEARLGRQTLLEPPHALRLSAVLGEAALRRPVGGTAVMRSQLESMLSFVDTSTTVVQVIPFQAGEHGLLGGTLELMTLDDGTSVSWEESVHTGTLTEDPRTVAAYQAKYDLLRSHALPPDQSAALIRSAMEVFPA